MVLFDVTPLEMDSRWLRVPGNPSLGWLIAALIGAVVLLVVLSLRRSQREHPHQMLGDRMLSVLTARCTAAGYLSLVVLGPVVWIQVPPMAGAMLGFPQETILIWGLTAFMASPVGLVVSIWARRWVKAALTVRQRLQRYLSAWLLLIGLTALVTGLWRLLERQLD